MKNSWNTGSRGFGHGLAEFYFGRAAEELGLRRGQMDLGYFTPESKHWKAYKNAVAAGGNFAIVNRLLIGRADRGSKVALDEASIPVFDDGRFLLGFGRDAAAKAALRVAMASGVVEARELAVAQREYEIQRINNLPKNQVEPNAEELKRIKAEQVRINAARARDTDLSYAFEPFDWPALGPISGVYGSQRILNGQPRQPHYGLDIAAPTGAPVVASAAGRVVMAERDLRKSLESLERVKGIEPSYSAWKAAALPLSYTRAMLTLPISPRGSTKKATLEFSTVFQLTLDNCNFVLRRSEKRLAGCLLA